MLSCSHIGPPSEHAHAHKQLERLLQKLVEEQSSGTDSLTEFENATKRKYKSPVAKWECLSLAIRILSTWGKYRTVVAFAVRQIEIVNEMDDSSKLSLGVASAWSKVIILADSYLNLAR